MKSYFLSKTQNYSELIRQPLIHLMILAWATGLVRGSFMAANNLTQFGPSVGLALNAILGFWLLRHFKQLNWAFIPILTTVIIILFVSYASGFQALWQLTLIAATTGALLQVMRQPLSKIYPLPTSMVGLLSFFIIISASLYLLLAGLFETNTPLSLLPTLAISMGYLLWCIRDRQENGLYHLLFSGFFLISTTLVYFSLNLKTHKIIDYLALGADQSYGLLIIGFATAIMIASNTNIRFFKHTTVYSSLGFVLVILAYAQDFSLLLNNPMSMTIKWMATAALMLYSLLKPVENSRALIATLSLAYCLFQALAWVMPALHISINLIAVTLTLLAIHTALAKSRFKTPSKALQVGLMFWLQTTLILAHVYLLIELDTILNNTWIIACLTTLNWVLYKKLRFQLWHIFSIVTSLYLWHSWHFLLPWSFSILDRIELVMLQTSITLLVYSLWAKNTGLTKIPKAITVIFMTGLFEWVLWLTPDFHSTNPGLLVSILMSIGYIAYLLFIVNIKQTESRAALLLGTLALSYGSIRTSFIGWQSMIIIDVFIAIAAAVILYAIHRKHPFTTLSKTSLGLSLFALLSAPILMAPWLSSITWIAISGFYLWVYTDTKQTSILATSILLLSSSIYLWMPRFMGQEIILQLYILPTALALLLILHLHRHEINPSLHHKLRLAFLSVLYVGAGIDVFMNPSFEIFLLSIGLGVAGILAGISLRIRAFLYGGTAFLVLNVIGQLLQFYPEQSLSKALVLMGLGAVVTVSMILFNMKRQAIIDKVNGVKFILKDWA